MSYYKTEQCFRRYEAVLTEALRQWPKKIKFKTDRALSTDAARCRDAVSAFRANNWIPKQHADLFQKVKEGSIRLKIDIEDNYVTIGPKTFDSDETDFVYDSKSDDRGAINFFVNTEDDLRAVIHLIEFNVIDFPVSIEPRWKDAFDELAQNCMNVVCSLDETTQKLYLL